ncbi:HDOD domain-containing protein [Vibrio maerlii]|uniref:HDOD domain-containing protein n=1 Tax=Vibrio maerlii TaxID=2231648 RepID=UPI000E3CB1B5|nr:HDOD domain-containing protein [Vibrio maerlii]
MTHLSFYWLPTDKNKLVRSIESEFAQLVEQTLKAGNITLPPIPDAVLKIQRLCTQDNVGIAEIADCLLEDPSLAALVIRVANSVIFNRRNIDCTDLITAVSRLGILRVRDIVTAQAVEELKQSLDLTKELNGLLTKSAMVSRELGATMVLVVNEFHKIAPETYTHLEQEKALLVGLLADIGLFCLVSEYHDYLNNGNYLNYELALEIFHSRCPRTSYLVLKEWAFDKDFIEVASNRAYKTNVTRVSYLDIARIANHLLLYRRQDEAIEEHEVEIDSTGAEVLYVLSNMNDDEFNRKISDVISSSGL